MIEEVTSGMVRFFSGNVSCRVAPYNAEENAALPRLTVRVTQEQDEVDGHVFRFGVRVEIRVDGAGETAEADLSDISNEAALLFVRSKLSGYRGCKGLSVAGFNNDGGDVDMDGDVWVRGLSGTMFCSRV